MPELKNLPLMGYSLTVNYTTPYGELTAEIKVSVTDSVGGTVEWNPTWVRWSEFFNKVEAELTASGEGFLPLAQISPQDLHSMWFKGVECLCRDITDHLNRIVADNVSTFISLPGQGRMSEEVLLALSQMVENKSDPN